jgi:hypothetical protein
MNLLRKIAVVATLGVALGCHDTSGPPALPANYMLVSVNGHPLPAIISPIPEAPTVLDGTLFLDGAGHALVREHQRVMIAPGDVTYTTNYTYTIVGGKVQFHIDCPPNALCIAPPVGIFVDGRLLVDMSGGAGSLVYAYQLVMPD